MVSKVNRIPMYGHPDFRELLKELQDSRVKGGLEDSQNKIALWRLTKTITNLIRANPSLFVSLAEVEINGVKY